MARVIITNMKRGMLNGFSQNFMSQNFTTNRGVLPISDYSNNYIRIPTRIYVCAGVC
jgi:hypothetical protein